MSEQKEPEAKPDDLAKPTKPEEIDLTEEQLTQVSGGAGGTQLEYRKADKVKLT